MNYLLLSIKTKNLKKKQIIDICNLKNTFCTLFGEYVKVCDAFALTAWFVPNVTNILLFPR